MSKPNQLPIGEIAKRTGLSVSAIRFYEERGLVQAGRNAGGQRRFSRSDIRRLSFVMIAQKMGFSIEQIKQALAPLPIHRSPTKAEWKSMAEGFRIVLEDRIDKLRVMHDTLDGCIGCGCLSLDHCALYNPNDVVADHGTGPRYLLDRDLPSKMQIKKLGV